MHEAGAKLMDIAHARMPKVQFFGIYKALVEFVNDPTQTGRIKVRIPALHGMPRQTKTEVLRWADPCFPFGGGPGFGSYLIPPVGSTVWVMFEYGELDRPVWIGTWPGIPNESPKMLRDSNQEHPTGPVSMSPSPDKPWTPPPGPEVPLDGLQQVNNRPERYVIFKSPKGATLSVEDRDEAEQLQLLDRAGQGLSMASPVRASKTDSDKFAANENNEAARKMRAATENDPLPVESSPTEEGMVTLADLGGQSLELKVRKGDNRVRLTSREGDVEEELTQAGNRETDGAAMVSLELAGTEGVATLEITRKGVPFVRLRLDGPRQTLVISALESVRLETKDLHVTGNLSVGGTALVKTALEVLGPGLFAGEVQSTNELGAQVIGAVDLPSL